MSTPTGKRIFIASDHAGMALKADLMKGLAEYNWVDLGPIDSNQVDYPDYAALLSRKIASGEAKEGVLICGSGIGMSISANKVAGIRAALVENPVSARLAREHNDANVLCLGSRFIAAPYGFEIVKAWLTASFSTEARHVNRVQKIRALETKSEQKD